MAQQYFSWRYPHLAARWTWWPSREDSVPLRRRIWQPGFPSPLPPVVDQGEQPICVPLSVIMCMQAQYNINGYRYLRQPVPRLSVRHGVEVFLSWPEPERTLLRFLTWVRDEGVLGENDYMRVRQRRQGGRAVDVPRYRIISFWRVDPNTPDFEEIVLQALFDSPVIGHFPITNEYDYTGEVNIRFRGGGQPVGFYGENISHSVMIVGEGVDNETFYEYQNTYGEQAGIDGFMELNQDPLEGVYIIRVSS